MDYYINKSDMTLGFFHFTDKKNLKSIMAKGLLPNIGLHAKNIESTKKVFFVEGLDNLLILFDCWLTALYYIPAIPIIYKLGAFFLKFEWFPSIIGDSYFKILKASKLQQKRAFKILDKTLKNGLLLKLDLEEDIDFSYNDKDEIKSKGYIKRHLEVCGYSEKYSDLNSNIMDRWNMHTFSNHIVSSKKINVGHLQEESFELRDIFNYCLKNTNMDLESICPELCAYLKYINYEGVLSEN